MREPCASLTWRDKQFSQRIADADCEDPSGLDSSEVLGGFPKVPAAGLRHSLLIPGRARRCSFPEEVGVLEARAVMKIVERVGHSRQGINQRYLFQSDSASAHFIFQSPHVHRVFFFFFWCRRGRWQLFRAHETSDVVSDGSPVTTTLAHPVDLGCHATTSTLVFDVRCETQCPAEVEEAGRVHIIAASTNDPTGSQKNTDTLESNVDAEPAPERDASSATTGGSSSDQGTTLQRQRCLIARQGKLRTLRYLDQHSAALHNGSTLLEHRTLSQPARQRCSKSLSTLERCCRTSGFHPGSPEEKWIRRWSHFTTSASWTGSSRMLEKPRSLCG